MKKYIILGVILLVIGSMVLVPFFQNKKPNTDNYSSELPAKFTFKDNLAVTFNEIIELSVSINSQEIKKLEIIYGDSILKTWKKPSKGITFQFNPSLFGIGTKPLSLVAYSNDGDKQNDNRMVRVLSDINPAIWIAKIKKSYPHNTSHYTQGLEFNEGNLYEGIGQYGSSKLSQIDLKTGKVNEKLSITLAGDYFGEGITILNDQVYQLTWDEQTCFVYNKKTFELEKTIPYIGEGWGLCNNGTSLIMSNGSERITFRNPETFAIERTIEVYDNNGPIQQLNELEFIDGKIYANVYTTNSVLVIDPETGRVEAITDCSILEKEGRGYGDVLNGIAHKDGEIYMTGKNWNKLFQVDIEKP